MSNGICIQCNATLNIADDVIECTACGAVMVVLGWSPLKLELFVPKVLKPSIEGGNLHGHSTAESHSKEDRPLGSVIPRDIEKPDPESTRGFFKNLIGVLDEFAKWKQFRNTRRLIKQGYTLFDCSADELSKNKLMGPWTFDVYETVIAAIPAQILARAIYVLFPSEETPAHIPESLNAYAKGLARETYKLMPLLDSFFHPLMVPTILLAVSWIISRGCLRREDSISQSRKRCRNAYLYYDGAYGLMPQTVASLALTMLLLFNKRHIQSDFATLVFGGFLAASLLYQIYLLYGKIPDLLFRLNGYSESTAPEGKYLFFVIFLAGPSSWMVVIGFSLIQLLVAFALAIGTIWLRGPN